LAPKLAPNSLALGANSRHEAGCLLAEVPIE
jgi:hypothetical protein